MKRKKKSNIEKDQFDSQFLSKSQPQETNEFDEIKKTKFSLIEEIAKILGDQLGLTLFGFDLIFEKETKEPYVVDVNYFPGTLIYLFNLIIYFISRFNFITSF